jgi:ATF/CREB family transcription factor
MFPPAPSPNSQALFQQLASGGATPGTLDFHRTAINAAAARNKELAAHNQFAPQNNTDLSQTQGQDQLVQGIQGVGVESKVPQQVQGVQASTDPFGQHDANDAANGLYLLAQARSDPQGSNQFTMPAQSNSSSDVIPPSSVATQIAGVRQTQENSPNLTKRSVHNASGSGSISGSARGVSEMSGDPSDSGASEQAKPNTRNRGKRGAAAKAGQSVSNGRRKADASPAGSRAQINKKSKGNSGNAQNAGSSDDDGGMPQDHESGGNDGKKMTDEEKRKNFLERNRFVYLYDVGSWKATIAKSFR